VQAAESSKTFRGGPRKQKRALLAEQMRDYLFDLRQGFPLAIDRFGKTPAYGPVAVQPRESEIPVREVLKQAKGFACGYLFSAHFIKDAF
jgi:hypothetical protein